LLISENFVTPLPYNIRDTAARRSLRGCLCIGAKSQVESESVPLHTGGNIIPKNSGNGVLRTRESEEAEHKRAGENCTRRASGALQKKNESRRIGLLPARIATSSSRNAVSLSSAQRTPFPSSRCASAIQIVRPLQSIAEMQPQLQPALLRMSAMIFQYFTSRIASLLLYTLNDKVPTTSAYRCRCRDYGSWGHVQRRAESLSKSTQFSSLASLHFCDKKARDEAWGRAGKHCSNNCHKPVAGFSAGYR
jgi:hypothetical protein